MRCVARIALAVGLSFAVAGVPSLADATTCDLTWPAPASSWSRPASQVGIVYTVMPDGSKQTLDLTMPAGETSPKLLIGIHGGSFVSGSSQSKWTSDNLLANNGFAVAELNYPLSTPTANQFPVAFQAIRCAVRTLRMWQSYYGYDASTIGVFGESAGANLAALLAVTGDRTDSSFDSPTCGAMAYSPKVQAAVAFYGLFDFTSITLTQVLYLAQYGSAINPAIALAASPLAYVNSASPPFILVHGQNDPLVPLDQQTSMQEALADAGVAVQRYEIPGEGHGFTPWNVPAAPAISQSMLTQADCAAISMLQTSLK